MPSSTPLKIKPVLYQDDLPVDVLNHYLSKSVISIDTETRGLVVYRDKLCLVQLCCDEGKVAFVRYRGKPAPNLVKLLTAQNVTKLFHYGRFDIAVLKYYLGAVTGPVWCTKIASKLVRTYTDRHSLKDLVRELLSMELDKSDQTSDWAREDLTDSQLEYAANDVRMLISLQQKLMVMLEREGRVELAQKLFAHLPTVCELDLLGFNNIYDH